MINLNFEIVVFVLKFKYSKVTILFNCSKKSYFFYFEISLSLYNVKIYCK